MDQPLRRHSVQDHPATTLLGTYNAPVWSENRGGSALKPRITVLTPGVDDLEASLAEEQIAESATRSADHAVCRWSRFATRGGRVRRRSAMQAATGATAASESQPGLRRDRRQPALLGGRGPRKRLRGAALAARPRRRPIMSQYASRRASLYRSRLETAGPTDGSSRPHDLATAHHPRCGAPTPQQNERSMRNEARR